MTPNDPPTVSMARRGYGRRGGDPLRTVVWVRGDHDIASRVQLAVTLARAIHVDDADVVVDLSGVTFMDASTIGVILVARRRLHLDARSLSVRDPSPPARRILDVCGLERLIDRVRVSTPSEAGALGTWVEVPASAAAAHTEPEPVLAAVRDRGRRLEPVMPRRRAGSAAAVALPPAMS